MQSACVTRALPQEAPTAHHRRPPTPRTMMWNHRCSRHRGRQSGRHSSRIRGCRDAQRSSQAVLTKSTVHQAHPAPAVLTPPVIFVKLDAQLLPHKQLARLSAGPLQNCGVRGACQAASCMSRWPDLPNGPPLMRNLGAVLRVGALAPRRCRSHPGRLRMHARCCRMTTMGDSQTPLALLKAFQHSR
jgi:hypothetical protein